MNDYLFQALRDFLRGTMTVSELDGVLASFDWDDTAAEAIRLQPAIQRLYLYTTEVIEGLRAENALWNLAARIVADVPRESATRSRDTMSIWRVMGTPDGVLPSFGSCDLSTRVWYEVPDEYPIVLVWPSSTTTVSSQAGVQKVQRVGSEFAPVRN